VAPTWSVLQLGTAEEDQAVAVAVDARCGLLVGGVTKGRLAGAELLGEQDAFLARLEAGGLAWVRQVGTAGVDFARDVVVSEAGVSVLVGDTLSAADGGVGPEEADVLAFSYGADGGLRWSARRAAAGNDFATGVARAPDGTLTVVGTTDVALERGFDFLTLRLGADDGVVHTETRSGAEGGQGSHERAEGVAFAADGSAFLAGVTTGEVAGPALGSTDGLLVHLAPDGAQRWALQLGTPDIDAFLEVAPDGAGGAYVLAVSFADLESGQAEGDGIQSPFLARVSAAGRLQWMRRLAPAADYSRAMGMAVGADGAVFVAGLTQGGLAGPNAGGRDAFAARYGPDGERRWVRQLGTAQDDEGRDVALLPSGELVLVGVTRGALGGGGSRGGTDAFIARLRQEDGALAGPQP
jgi:hypothetical protein